MKKSNVNQYHAKYKLIQIRLRELLKEIYKIELSRSVKNGIASRKLQLKKYQ